MAVTPPQPTAPIDVAAEVAQLRSALLRGSAAPDLGQAQWIARTSVAIAASGLAIDRPQLVVVDRNPMVQQMRLILAGPQGEWDDLSGTKISTG